MTDDEINIAIAEACGWTCLGQVEGCKPHGYPPDARKPTTKELLEAYGPSPWDVPDYCNDLNACRKIAERLNSSENDSQGAAVAFCEALEEIHEEDNSCWIECAVPSAKQVCRAFLRAVKNKII